MEIVGGKLGFIIVIWVDIDVLLIEEKINLLFVFEVNGVMYVCGYDFYIVFIIGVVIFFKEC